jgi:Concanavalin A-like lectin/glucanases superfamily
MKFSPAKTQCVLTILAVLTTTFVHAQGTSCTPPPSGIISWWAAEGNTLDYINTNGGTPVGALSYTNGEVGQAFSLDGTTSYVLITNAASLNPPGSFSMECWIYPTQDGDQKILSKWGDSGAYGDQRSYNLVTTPGLGVGFSFCDASNQEDGSFQQFSVPNVLTLNKWSHVAATYDIATGIRSLYVNGVKVGLHTNSPVDAVYASSAPVTIGAWSRDSGIGNTQNYFQGLIDEVSLYGRALSDSEIQAIYNAGSAGKCVPACTPHAATGIATRASAFVIGVMVTDSGCGYTNTPLVRLIGGGGSGAQAVALVSNELVVAVNIINAGNGYTNVPLVVIDPPFISKAILNISPISVLTFSNLTVGSSYQLQQFQPPSWISQFGSLTAGSTLYTQFVSGVSDGSDYRLALTPLPSQALAAPQVFNGFVIGALVISGGSGYVTPPAVTIVGNGNVGSNATAVASINNIGAVTNVAIINAGMGYASPVTIQIDPPPVTALSPIVMPGMRLDASNLAPYDNYQFQFKSDIRTAWLNWNSLFSPTNITSSQYVFITNGIGFFQLEYVP